MGISPKSIHLAHCCFLAREAFRLFVYALQELPPDSVQRHDLYHRFFPRSFEANETPWAKAIREAAHRGDLSEMLVGRIEKLRDTMQEFCHAATECPQGNSTLGHIQSEFNAFNDARNDLEPLIIGSEEPEELEAQSEKETASSDQGGKAISKKRSWVQKEVDDAIRDYRAKRARSYGNLADGVKRSKKGAKIDARKIFGRNVIADFLECSKAMVSKSTVWRAIAEELGLSGRTPGIGPGERVGLDMAIEEAGVAEHKSKEREGRQGQSDEEQVKELAREQNKDEKQRKIPPEW